MEVSPEKAPGQKTPSGTTPQGADVAKPDRNLGAPGEIPSPSQVELLDLDAEPGPETPEPREGVATSEATSEADVASDGDSGAPLPTTSGAAKEPTPPLPPARPDAASEVTSASSTSALSPTDVATPLTVAAVKSPVPLPPTVGAQRGTSGPTPSPALPPVGVDPLDAMPRVPPRRPSALGGGDYQRTGHPVRDRLLAKAAEAQASSPGANASEPAAGPFSALRGMEAELEQLAGPRQKLLSEPVRLGNAVLSPTATLVGVTVIGLAIITSLFLLLVKFAPRSPEQTAGDVGAVGVGVPSTAPTAGVMWSPETVTLPPPVAAPERKREQGPWRIINAEPGQRLIRGTVGSNPFLRSIQDAGINKNQAYRVYAALKGHKDLDHCRPKDEFIALVDQSDKRVVAFEYVVSKEEVYQAKEQDGKLVGKALDLKVSKHRVQGSILVTSAGFGAAAQNAGLETSIADVVNRALAGHTSVSQFRPGDRLRVVAQEVTVLGEFHRYAGIEALEYIPVEGEPTRIYYHAAKRQYYDAKGRAPGEGGWRSPVRGAPITSKFNPQRLHPILKKKMPHNGTDFGAPTGTPIYAASYGKITKLGNYGPNGNFIAIEHDNGYETGYSHLSRFEPGLKVGDNVKRAQVIGYVGSTGRSTGPHLHFSARKNGAYIDPESLHLDALTVLPAAERAVFQGVKEKYDVLLEAVALPPALPASLAVASPTAALEDDMHGEGAEEGDQVAGASPLPVAPPPPPVPLVQPGSPLVGAPQAAPISTLPAPIAPGGAFFLSDKDLLQNQPAIDDGEVDE